MNFFMYVKYAAGLNEIFNFENIFRSIITLFPMVTSAGWSGVLEALTNDHPPYCNDTLPLNSQIAKGDCGNSSVAIPFMVSYLIITFLIVVNMYIAVILENFGEAREEVQVGLTDDDYDMYYEVWQRYDPKGTEFILLEHLSDFVNNLQKPLKIAKPNRLKLISMNLTICTLHNKDVLHCLDILDALTKNYLGTSEGIELSVPELEKIRKERPSNYRPKTTTIKLERENYCAKVITKALREYCRKRKIIRLKNKNMTRALIDEISSNNSYYENDSDIFDTSTI